MWKGPMRLFTHTWSGSLLLSIACGNSHWLGAGPSWRWTEILLPLAWAGTGQSDFWQCRVSLLPFPLQSLSLQLQIFMFLLYYSQWLFLCIKNLFIVPPLLFNCSWSGSCKCSKKLVSVFSMCMHTHIPAAHTDSHTRTGHLPKVGCAGTSTLITPGATWDLVGVFFAGLETGGMAEPREVVNSTPEHPCGYLHIKNWEVKQISHLTGRHRVLKIFFRSSKYV